MFNKKARYGSFFVTFIVGAITGASIALLYTPLTGKKMQKRVSDVTDKVLDVVEDQIENVQGFVKKVANA